MCFLISQESTETALQAGRTVETTRARLQGQLHLKEAENNRLTAQLRVSPPLWAPH